LMFTVLANLHQLKLKLCYQMPYAVTVSASHDPHNAQGDK
jgi:hypothetical protein